MERVIIEVDKGNKGCSHGHKAGQRMIFDGTRITGDICIPALVGLFPILYTLRSGGKLYYADDEGKVCANCGDPDNTVTFKCWRKTKEDKV